VFGAQSEPQAVVQARRLTVGAFVCPGGRRPINWGGGHVLQLGEEMCTHLVWPDVNLLTEQLLQYAGVAERAFSLMTNSAEQVIGSPEWLLWRWGLIASSD
jgi:hypothetical protein